MAIAYIWVHNAASKSRHAAGRACSLDDHILTKKMAILVVTDGICWTPIFVTGILGLNNYKISPQWVVWLAFFILPVNSALNPFLYSFSTISRYYKK
jgi:hypothetical protein